jgi:tetratricopeptide (TPR) repeat protein
LELEKNVIPVLVDDASVNDISPAFTRRKAVLELNFFRLPHDLFEQAITVLIERFLTQPTLQELRIRTAKEHFETAKQAADGEDWEVAEAEYGKAVASQTRPEYFFGRGLAKYQLGRYDEALNDFDAAISLDPFTFELMKNKFNLLQELGGWKMRSISAGDGTGKQRCRLSTSGPELLRGSTAKKISSRPSILFLNLSCYTVTFLATTRSANRSRL